MNDDQKLRQRSKTPYAKPSVERISLRLEEAVLGSCKTAGQTGPGGGGVPIGHCPLHQPRIVVRWER